MDKIERIRKRIEELLNDWKYGSSTEAKYRCEAYKELLEELDVLQRYTVNEDLEEAANKYGKEQYGRKISLLPDRCRGCYAPIVTAFKAGNNWHKEMMMKDAVGGYVIEDIEEGNGDFLLSADYLPASMGLKDRQKVKVIVITDE